MSEPKVERKTVKGSSEEQILLATQAIEYARYSLCDNLTQETYIKLYKQILQVQCDMYSLAACATLGKKKSAQELEKQLLDGVANFAATAVRVLKSRLADSTEKTESE